MASDDDVFWTYEKQRKSNKQSKLQQSTTNDCNKSYLPNQQYNHRDSLLAQRYQNDDHQSDNSFLNETKNSPQFYVPPIQQENPRAILGQLLSEESVRNQPFQQNHLRIETTKNISNKKFMDLSTRSPKSVQNKSTSGINGQSFRRIPGSDKENFQGSSSRLITENLIRKLTNTNSKQANDGNSKYARKGSSIWEDLYKEGQFQLEKKKVIQQLKKEKEESEFDFKPKLKISKKKTVSSLEIDSFFERNEAWKDQRDNKLISQRQTQIYLDLKQCTFSPVVNKSRSISKFFKNEQPQQDPQRISRALSSSSMASPKVKYQQIYQQNTALISQLQQKEIDRLEKNNKELGKQLKISQAKLLLEAMRKEKEQQMGFQQETSFGYNDGYYDQPRRYEQLYRHTQYD